jgi:hypothetical protein
MCNQMQSLGANQHQTDVEQTRNYWSDRARIIGLTQNGCQLNRYKFSFIKGTAATTNCQRARLQFFHARLREALVLALALRIAIMKVQRRSRRDV